MKKDDILEQLDIVRERLLIALEPLPDEAFLLPEVMGDWSLADILAHLIVWESEMVTALMRIEQGKTPTRLLEAFADVDSYNAKRYIENRGRDLDLIFDDLQGVRRRLEEWLDYFEDRDLEDPNRYEWSQGLPLWHIIKENSFGHEAEHIPDIEAFARRYNKS